MKYEVESVRLSPEEVAAESTEDAIREYVEKNCLPDIVDQGSINGTTCVRLWCTPPGGVQTKYVARVTLTTEIESEQKDW